MSMSGSNQVKVQFMLDDKFGFEKGRIYDAFLPQTKFGNTEMVCVIDKFGEEYAYPASWFEIIETTT